MSIRRSLALCATAFALLLSGVPAHAATAPHLEKAVLAGGCFWGMEGVFESLSGVTQVVSGFAGGDAASAHYETVSTGTTGHAESVEITYDPARIAYHQLLEVFFTAHDPTTVDRQGPDEGPQYRSAIFYANDEQRREAQSEIAALTRAHAFNAPIVTQVVPLHGFYAAEAYHQHYMALHPYSPYILINDKPKVAAVRAKFPQLVKKTS
ncbi:MAG TPA: peptide-methionine (S)-S-oxide reductase MsrA [Candidatus Limnocylindria bacterium]|jgi:peptide-methionine (S)-S-oxide reductase|nr:peptide-methionine (S)-S-oxide reductase MsrA [Candidatus Limnocylindria bacterium]